ncbi:MAG: ester cyclase [Devosia sp.]|nr:ester cyclase [Devosia sp.]
MALRRDQVARLHQPQRLRRTGSGGFKEGPWGHYRGRADLKVAAEDVFVSADGSRVVGRYRYEGTHTGSLLGYSGTGKPFVMRSIDIWRVENGRFVEHWDELNTLDVLVIGPSVHICSFNYIS